MPNPGKIIRSIGDLIIIVLLITIISGCSTLESYTDIYVDSVIVPVIEQNPTYTSAEAQIQIRTEQLLRQHIIDVITETECAGFSCVE